ncbi:E2 [Human papillomavirus]|uniref:Regulatory protein E2 n=1 Tax=Human papillomavirus TaxID=10566 RepID=A0A0K1YWP0_9PAPI|nr:E2 [Human papillomavirus]AKZ17768.1 E2 [Human papillomavirus]
MMRMETQETLTDRFNALQDAILNLIEENPSDLKSIIRYWELNRKEHVTLYYARKEGFTRLGLQPVPTPAVSEYNAKQAIQMQLLVNSLSKSVFAKETWTLSDCSAELINTLPKDCFKKQGYTVEVWYDNDRNKAYPYTNWKRIYYQDSHDEWQLTEGKVDENGLYYDEKNGDRVYFMLFGADADKYGVTKEWTVHYRDTTIVSSSSSSRRVADSSQAFTQPSTSGYSKTPSPKRRRAAEEADSSTSSSSSSAPSGSPASNLRDRGGGQGERSVPLSKRRRHTSESAGESAVPSPSEVGTGHRLLARQALGRVQRLQAEAWDPFILILKGPSNNLKCWRNRNKHNHVHVKASSNVWRWLGEGYTYSRMLLAFDSETERERFVQFTRFPKDTTYAYGNLESL